MSKPSHTRTGRFAGSEVARLAVCMIFTVSLVAGGCRKKDEGPRIMSLEGKVESIEAEPDGTGKLVVVYYNEKQKRDVAGTAFVTKETEIMIDGALATLADLREGERVRGEIRVDKKGGERTQTVLKLYVDRAKRGGD